MFDALGNGQMRPQAKRLTALVIRDTAGASSEWLRIDFDVWAERLGVSRSTVSRHFRALAQYGVIEKRIEYTYDFCTGFVHPQVLIRPTELLLSRPQDIAMDTGHGGRRFGAGRPRRHG